MSKETSDEKRKDKADKGFADDPPIIVGGGSSLYLFIKTGLGTPISSPLPGYECIRLPDNITVLRISDGISPRIHAIPLKADRFGANFDKS